MDNYKIINTYTNEIIKALNDLGYVWTPMKFDEQDCLLKAHWILAEQSGAITYASGTMIDSPLDFKELTLPKLRDLVVLKRGDVKDANYTYAGNPVLKLETQDYKVWDEAKQAWLEYVGSQTDLRRGLKPIQTVQAVLNNLDELREEYKDYHKDPALISGAEAKLAWAKGESVQFRDEFDKWYADWTDLNSKKNGFCITDFDLPHHQFRIKPTITVNAELPKPNKETQHNSLVYAVTYEFKTREERNAFADKLRGTNHEYAS